MTGSPFAAGFVLGGLCLCLASPPTLTLAAGLATVLVGAVWYKETM
jgi:hypothetical protein